jgi:hypothetical protein
MVAAVENYKALFERHSCSYYRLWHNPLNLIAFQILLKRWIVERIFNLIIIYWQFSVDYERKSKILKSHDLHSYCLTNALKVLNYILGLFLKV